MNAFASTRRQKLFSFCKGWVKVGDLTNEVREAARRNPGSAFTAPAIEKHVKPLMTHVFALIQREADSAFCTSWVQARHVRAALPRPPRVSESHALANGEPVGVTIDLHAS